MRTPPYLPFLDGPARVAPQLKPISPESWLQPDTEASDWLPAKRTLMRSRPQDVIFLSQWAAPDVSAICAMISDHLGRVSPDPNYPPREAFEQIASEVSDDLCIMVERGGLYHLEGAVLCAPTFWKLPDKAGQPLGGLHSPVPGGDPELASRISRIFSGLQEGLVLERFNWTVQLDGERFTPDAAPMKAALAGLSVEEAEERLHFRVERQTIRKVPGSASVLFTLRIVMDPLKPILSDPQTRRIFHESWTNTAPDLAEYKGWSHYQRVIDYMCRD